MSPVMPAPARAIRGLARAADADWRPGFGNADGLGFRFQWHELGADASAIGSQPVQAGSVEVCLNLAGCAILRVGTREVDLNPRTSVFCYHGDPPVETGRRVGEPHRFVTVEFAPSFLKQHLATEARHLHPAVRAVVDASAQASVVSDPEPLGTTMLALIESLRHCPVFKPAQATWFRCKALELAAQSFFSPPEGELFCTRQQRAACERASRARAILSERLAEPPSLAELGRLVGCSPFHLSRQFSQATGLTIQQFLRQARLARAAELLCAGRHNVTEAALEVGYHSLSHFTVAFREAFGCGPGLYPVRISSSPATEGPLERARPPRGAGAGCG